VATGANDVANSFSTAVAAKTITHRQAIVLAFFAEFTGAMVLGSSVTDTVFLIFGPEWQQEPHLERVCSGACSLLT